jgi:hypothetical protein
MRLSRNLVRRAGLTGAVRVALTGLLMGAVCGSAAFAAGLGPGSGVRADAAIAPDVARATPARDHFTGSISRGTGSFAGTQGAVSIRVFVGPQIGSFRAFSLAIGPLPCTAGGHCTSLSGRASGHAARAGEPIADVGITLRFRAAGRVSPIGHVSATGVVRGTGFIARGHEWLQLSLTGRAGSVTIEALSPLVPGFTTP